MFNKQNAFTLMELLIVVVLMAVLAGFGIPNYTKSRDKANEKEGVHILRLIASAMDTYGVRNNAFPPADLPQVTDINDALNLGIVEQNLDYNCTCDGISFECTAVSAFGWSLQVTDVDDGNPDCSAGTCPTCLVSGCP